MWRILSLLCMILLTFWQGNSQLSPVKLIQYLDDYDVAQDIRGWGAEFEVEGDIMTVSAIYDDRQYTMGGSVHVFKRIDNVWTQVFELLPDDYRDWIYFGGGSIDARRIACATNPVSTLDGGPRKAYIFDEDSPGSLTWTQMNSFNVYSGFHLYGIYALSVVSTDNGNTGAVYLYTEISAYTYDAGFKVTASDAAAQSWFGSSFDFQISNGIMAVGALDNAGNYQAGAVYMFALTTSSTFVEESKLVSSTSEVFYRFGYAVVLQGTRLIVGASRANSLTPGSVHIFDEVSPSVWVEQVTFQSSNPTGNDYFGTAIALDETGTTLVVGSYGADKLEIFHETAPNVWELGYYGVSNVEDSKYGKSVWINGTTIMVTTFNDPYQLHLHEYDTIDDCIGNACEHGSICQNVYLNYTCNCPPAYDGGWLCDQCQCENGGICYDDIDTGVGACDCTGLAYMGNKCDKYCYNGVADSTSTGCNCTLSGATGKFCTKDVDDCLSSPCAHGGTCTDYGADLFPNHNNEFNCTCDGTGYHGATCEISDCVSSPCLNNGMCEQAYDHDDVPSGVQCNCSHTGYEGDWCQTEVDECASSPCLNDGICTDLLGDFTCDCTGTGYEGKTCIADADDCLSSPCFNGGTCQDKGKNKFKCTCDNIGYEGIHCDINIDDCLSAPCYNGGTCIDGIQDFTCDCTGTGYEGGTCEDNHDDCLSLPCNDGATCIDELNDYTCNEADPCINVTECIDSKVCIATDDKLSYTCVGPVSLYIPALVCSDHVVDCANEDDVEDFIVMILIDDIGGSASDFNISLTLVGSNYNVDIIYADEASTFANNADFAASVDSSISLISTTLRGGGSSSSSYSAASAIQLSTFSFMVAIMSFLLLSSFENILFA